MLCRKLDFSPLREDRSTTAKGRDHAVRAERLRQRSRNAVRTRLNARGALGGTSYSTRLHVEDMCWVVLHNAHHLNRSRGRNSFRAAKARGNRSLPSSGGGGEPRPYKL